GGAVNLVRSGTKQPQPFSTSAEGRARHLPLFILAPSLFLLFPFGYPCRLPLRFLTVFSLHRRFSAGLCSRAFRARPKRLCRLTLLIQFRHDLSSSRTQMAAEILRVARRPGARRSCAHARTRRRPPASRLSVHGHARRRQDDALAHLREGAQL